MLRKVEHQALELAGLSKKALGIYSNSDDSVFLDDETGLYTVKTGVSRSDVVSRDNTIEELNQFFLTGNGILCED